MQSSPEKRWHHRHAGRMETMVSKVCLSSQKQMGNIPHLTENDAGEKESHAATLSIWQRKSSCKLQLDGKKAQWRSQVASCNQAKRISRCNSFAQERKVASCNQVELQSATPPAAGTLPRVAVVTARHG